MPSKSKMKIIGKAGIITMMVPAFLLYFLSESMLRQAAVSNINPQSVNVESLMTKLPSSVRDSVSSKIETTRLRNAIKEAETDSEKAIAIINYADRTSDQGQRLWLYSELVKEYPHTPECYVLYSRFMLNEGDGPKFSMEDYQSFVLLFDQALSYNMWIAGVNRLIMLKKPLEVELKFLAPLLSMKPEYREYGKIYQEISRVAEKEGKESLLARADSLSDFCRSLPTIDEVLKKRADAAKAPAKPAAAPAASGAAPAKPAATPVAPAKPAVAPGATNAPGKGG